MKPREVLIIGAGFLGTALARRLAADGLSVHLLSPNPREPGEAEVHIHRGELQDESLVDTLVSRCDTVIHAASTTTPGSSAADPIIEGTHNILPTLKLIAVMQRHPGVHLVYLSSGGCVYGNPVSTPVDETHSLRPQSYHGAGKATVEAFLHAFRACSMAAHPVTVLRPSNLYGPGQPRREGFGLIRTALEKLCADSVLDIWGDGETIRDFIYIDDLVDVCRRFADLPQDSETYNVASGLSSSINQLLEIIGHVCGKSPRVRYWPGRPADVVAVVLDSTKLRRCLDWKPAVSLEQGIARTWRWLNET